MFRSSQEISQGIISACKLSICTRHMSSLQSYFFSICATILHLARIDYHTNTPCLGQRQYPFLLTGYTHKACIRKQLLSLLPWSCWPVEELHILPSIIRTLLT